MCASSETSAGFLRDELKCMAIPGPNPKRAEVSTIGGQNSVDAASLGYGGDSSIHQAKLQFPEFHVQFEASDNIRWNR